MIVTPHQVIDEMELVLLILDEHDLKEQQKPVSLIIQRAIIFY